MLLAHRLRHADAFAEAGLQLADDLVDRAKGSLDWLLRIVLIHVSPRF
jgi:hypothetical protein